MELRISEESWVRRLTLQYRTLRSMQDFVWLNRDSQVEIPVEVDQPVKVDHDTHQNHDYPCSNFNLSRVRL
jgi:hypothetical protein